MSVGKPVSLVILSFVVAAVVQKACKAGDFLKGYTSEMRIPGWQFQMGVMAFCVSPLVTQINRTVEHRGTDIDYTFVESGGINEDDYDKGSIYAILYNLYEQLGEITYANRTFEFTFNTWGVAPSDFGEDDPQRHGKTSYSYFSKSAEVQQQLTKADGKVQIVEIGCGTGAGASHLSQNVFPNSKYMAIDMQKAAIDTCNRLHASDRLECVHIPQGVGNAGGAVPLADSSADFVIILETHIAEQSIGPEEKAIFAEVTRVLKPGGYFLWGNALPTGVWHDAEKYLPTIGYTTVDRWNNTLGAVRARDEDSPRCDAVIEAVKKHFVAFEVPYFGEPCHDVISKLILNFYRDKGTALYDKMVQGFHSYMHYVFKLEK